MTSILSPKIVLSSRSNFDTYQSFTRIHGERFKFYQNTIGSLKNEVRLLLMDENMLRRWSYITYSLLEERKVAEPDVRKMLQLSRIKASELDEFELLIRDGIKRLRKRVAFETKHQATSVGVAESVRLVYSLSAVAAQQKAVIRAAKNTSKANKEVYELLMAWSEKHSLPINDHGARIRMSLTAKSESPEIKQQNFFESSHATANEFEKVFAGSCFDRELYCQALGSIVEDDLNLLCTAPFSSSPKTSNLAIKLLNLREMATSLHSKGRRVGMIQQLISQNQEDFFEMISICTDVLSQVEVGTTLTQLMLQHSVRNFIIDTKKTKKTRPLVLAGISGSVEEILENLVCLRDDFTSTAIYVEKTYKQDHIWQHDIFAEDAKRRSRSCEIRLKRLSGKVERIVSDIHEIDKMFDS